MKTKVPTIDAQQFKRRLTYVIGKIGNRKRIRASFLFDVMIEVTKNVH